MRGSFGIARGLAAATLVLIVVSTGVAGTRAVASRRDHTAVGARVLGEQVIAEDTAAPPTSTTTVAAPAPTVPPPTTTTTVAPVVGAPVVRAGQWDDTEKVADCVAWALNPAETAEAGITYWNCPEPWRARVRTALE